ncbi:hypothetical protein COW36_04350 [bacterium (Candidatus Blackallbacteria) CG17_big_fil_post_rev_8_21_14_2_50_48_46]|uniref:Uncharacterized protein n=1 Tax=bacterium (Candidatus Blackallbacteria) CG17_big_fil_post_rev_8_21_14_2_50_48_46 TaxID=2014261 RepID=A0A2M7G8U6_9BACT|nr:MAG: hypothetical protein COW64_04595 [bacterium (Candidatus Blackallbacteria) CG18_big_fil_WC_8_21_14_2_50_49_26]PIW18530.1 MAG: hypothetical protein COW36_04350 [bacterium (Candidatus Blackallbacteria) CG17_big_fil_post_rev_8_21_14_2_50_48_46]PIW46485.1 MAG: hypothetical protein COW20_16330 [bacterium (Candidatus Blackallbacteria) CG13_big_fil_rev_8_21_14_2_50_49_14]
MSACQFLEKRVQCFPQPDGEKRMQALQICRYLEDLPTAQRRASMGEEAPKPPLDSLCPWAWSNQDPKVCKFYKA